MKTKPKFEHVARNKFFRLIKIHHLKVLVFQVGFISDNQKLVKLITRNWWSVIDAHILYRAIENTANQNTGNPLYTPY